jgi:hypothetical protein
MSITNEQMRLLMKAMEKDPHIGKAAAKAGMCRQTASKFLHSAKMPSELKTSHDWRTRPDPFVDYWPEVETKLEDAPELEATTLFDWLCREHPGMFQEGQLRTLQRRIHDWRALRGPEREIFFPQVHRPGENMQLDFTSMNALGITINATPYPHLFCHCVLTYSNWEWGEPCQSESLLAIRHGFQSSIFRLGRTPATLCTDSSSAATHTLGALPSEEAILAGKRAFNHRYLDMLRHFGIKPRVITLGRPNENGDVESLNGAFKKRVRQYLLLRGSTDFPSLADYTQFLHGILEAANTLRQARLDEERAVMPPLTASRLCAFEEERMRVGPSGTVRVLENTYSVPSRLRGEWVTVRVHVDHIEIYYRNQLQMQEERLLGRGHARINYRHMIGSLSRKPGALRNYRYREEMFPTPRFRMTYDLLCETCSERTADIEYVRILSLAANTRESAVDEALACLLDAGRVPRIASIEELMPRPQPHIPALQLPLPDLKAYDAVLGRVWQ